MSLRLVVWLSSLIFLAPLAGCDDDDSCYGIYNDCETDEICQPAGLPPGRCLDDRVTGRVCSFYYDACPTKLRWARCAGRGDNKSPLAGYCVRPEYLSDLGMDATPDMSAASAGRD